MILAGIPRKRHASSSIVGVFCSKQASPHAIQTPDTRNRLQEDFPPRRRAKAEPLASLACTGTNRPFSVLIFRRRSARSCNSAGNGGISAESTDHGRGQRVKRSKGEKGEARTWGRVCASCLISAARDERRMAPLAENGGRALLTVLPRQESNQRVRARLWSVAQT